MTSGMKDRMALAATLNAKVCTSLSSRYLTIAVPSWRRRYHLESCGGAEASRAMGTSVTSTTTAGWISGSACVPGFETTATERLAFLNRLNNLAHMEQMRRLSGK